jgi:hypothetical protein
LFFVFYNLQLIENEIIFEACSNNQFNQKIRGSMKKIILFLSCLSSIPFTNTGVSFDTIIQTVDGPKEISSLRQDDEVICFDDQLKDCLGLVENIESKTLDNVIEIITTDDVIIRVAPEQKFFSFYKWINAEDLSLNDVLFTKNKSLTRIKSIRHLQEKEIFFFIDVKDHHNFLATEKGILIHNGAGGASAGALIGRFVGWSVGVTICGIISAPALLAGPVAFAGAWAATTGAAAPYIEGASHVTAIAGGIIGGVATGPV